MPRDIDNRHVVRPGNMTLPDEIVAHDQLHLSVQDTPVKALGVCAVSEDATTCLSADSLRLLSAWALSAAEWLEKQEKADGS